MQTEELMAAAEGLVKELQRGRTSGRWRTCRGRRPLGASWTYAADGVYTNRVYRLPCAAR